ncbi:hypothetical protein RJ55_02910 [Drechmeria coniospora]|nr:hypothetical protein RJ55_02910 [Drechmeria coniospora]
MLLHAAPCHRTGLSAFEVHRWHEVPPTMRHDTASTPAALACTPTCALYGIVGERSARLASMSPFHRVHGEDWACAALRLGRTVSLPLACFPYPVCLFRIWQSGRRMNVRTSHLAGGIRESCAVLSSDGCGDARRDATTEFRRAESTVATATRAGGW